MQEYLFARSYVVTEARAHDIPSVLDLVAMGYRGQDSLDELEAEARNGKRMGFTGKQCIDPGQVRCGQPSLYTRFKLGQVGGANRRCSSQGVGPGKRRPGHGWQNNRQASGEQGRKDLVPGITCGIDVDQIKQQPIDQNPE